MLTLIHYSFSEKLLGKDKTMFATNTNVRELIMVVVLLTISVVQTSNINSIEIDKQWSRDIMKYQHGKDHRCHRPLIKGYCNISMTYISGWQFSSWFYDPLFKSCRPLFTPTFVQVCTENQDLPRTREMCEDLCGESCIMNNGSIGVCMYNKICKVYNNQVNSVPNTCGENGNCCPKVTDSRLDKFIDPSKDTDGIVESSKRRLVKYPSSSQPYTLYVYHLPNRLHGDGIRYK